MSETEFLKIADAKTALKGSFKGIIIKAGDLKSGTSNGKDWTKKIFTIEDESGTAELVTWGEEVSQFKMGYKYEIVNPWWKTYVDKQNISHITVQVGNYGTAKVIGSNKEIPDTPTPPPAQTLKDKPKPEPKPPEGYVSDGKGHWVKKSKPESPPEPAVGEPKIEGLEDDELAIVEKATKTLLAISLAVGETVKEVTEEPSREFVMEATKIIYQTYFVSNFKKASEM